MRVWAWWNFRSYHYFFNFFGCGRTHSWLYISALHMAYKEKSKIHWRPFNLLACATLVHELANPKKWPLNLSICATLVHELANAKKCPLNLSTCATLVHKHANTKITPAAWHCFATWPPLVGNAWHCLWCWHQLGAMHGLPEATTWQNSACNWCYFRICMFMDQGGTGRQV